MRARRTEGLRACQFPCQGRSGEKGGAIWDGGSGGRSRHNVVVGMDGREAGRDGEVRLLLLRLRLFFLTAIILVGEEDLHENMIRRFRQSRSENRIIDLSRRERVQIRIKAAISDLTFSLGPSESCDKLHFCSLV